MAGSIAFGEPDTTFDGRHIRHIFCGGNGVQQLINEAKDDDTSGTVGNHDYKGQPLAGTHAAGASAVSGFAKTNQIVSFDEAAVYNGDREKDLWLLIYADMLPDRAPDPYVTIPCSFDISVTGKFRWHASGHAQTEAM